MRTTGGELKGRAALLVRNGKGNGALQAGAGQMEGTGTEKERAGKEREREGRELDRLAERERERAAPEPGGRTGTDERNVRERTDDRSGTGAGGERMTEEDGTRERMIQASAAMNGQPPAIGRERSDLYNLVRVLDHCKATIRETTV